jgi:hypothetical protein
MKRDADAGNYGCHILRIFSSSSDLFFWILIVFHFAGMKTTMWHKLMLDKRIWILYIDG